MKRFVRSILLAVVAIAALLQACEDEVNSPAISSASSVVVSPVESTLGLGSRQSFTATFNGASGHEFMWSVVAGPGQISSAGEYTAPAQLSLYSVTATIRAVLASDTTKVGYARIVITGTNTGNQARGDSTGTGGSDTTSTPKDTTVCFERDILPILRSNCAMSGCHDAYTREEDIDLTSYQSLMNSGDDELVVAHNVSKSDLYEVITSSRASKRMPPPPRSALTAEQIALIRRWILEGAVNRDCSNDTVTCNVDNVTYAATIQPLLQTNCVGCHSGSAPSGGVLLTTYANVKAQADNGKLVGAVSHATGYKAMPPGGRLQNCAIEQIKVWVQAGALNN